MFGIFYFLFMGCASLFDSAKTGWHRLKDQEKAEQSGTKEYVDDKGRLYYGGIRAVHGTVNGEHVLQSAQTGQVLRNYDHENWMYQDRWYWEHYEKNRKEAMEEGKGCFFITTLWDDHRGGLYETKTGEKIFLSRSPGGFHYYKAYFKINVFAKSYVDWDSQQEITEEEWRSLGGEWGEIKSKNNFDVDLGGLQIPLKGGRTR